MLGAVLELVSSISHISECPIFAFEFIWDLHGKKRGEGEGAGGGKLEAKGQRLLRDFERPRGQRHC